MTDCILTINGGSSSIKFAVFDCGAVLQRRLTGEIERVGESKSELTATDAKHQPVDNRPVNASSPEQAVHSIMDWLNARFRLDSIAAIGHRVVHGGPQYAASQPITPELVLELQRISPLDPMHLPGEIEVIEAIGRRLPQVFQVACFDTAFHHDLPRQAQLLPVPWNYQADGVRRYGFHGISFAYLMGELARCSQPAAAEGRVILAHLGAGASLAAVRDGKCIDTSMAFTPTAGLVMGTRSGDLDPGLMIYLMRNEKMTADRLDDLVNRRSGLLGVSGSSSDMRDLLAREATDSRAADAVTLFCYQAKKWVGAMTAALGGLDTLVFSGGIGTNSPVIRARICDGLEFLGLSIEPSRNTESAAVISTDQSIATARVMKTDEELMIARDVMRIIGNANHQ